MHMINETIIHIFSSNAFEKHCCVFAESVLYLIFQLSRLAVFVIFQSAVFIVLHMLLRNYSKWVTSAIVPLLVRPWRTD